MDTLESRLREHFDRPGRATAPDVAAGIAGAYRIRRRRAAWHAGLGAVAAGVAVAAVVAVTTLVTAAPTPPAAVPVPTTVDWTRWWNTGPAGLNPYNFAFVDDRTGYAEAQSCGTTVGSCAKSLYRTDDSGRTWHKVTLSGGATIKFDQGVVKVFDADHVVLTALTLDDDALAAGGWTTADGGRTWQPIVRRPVGTVAYAPPGTLFIPVAPHAGGGPREAAIYPDGHLDIVTSVPAGLSGGGRPTNVPVYAYGGDIGDEIWVSTDQARTWRAAALPFEHGIETVTPLGGTGNPQYAYIPPTGPGGNGRLLASTDHGVTWAGIALPARTPVIPPADGSDAGKTLDTTSAVLAPDGGVLFNDGARTWRLAPGATEFTPDDQRFPITGLIQVGPGVVAYSADLRQPNPVVTRWLTTDGVHWQRVTW